MNEWLNINSLLKSAEAQEPGGNFSDKSFKSALETYIHSLQHQAQLHPAGVYAACSGIISSLKRRRQFSLHMEQNPGVVTNPIIKPIVIASFPRTGTTLLHNLFAADPINRVLYLWEMREPYAEDSVIAKVIAETQQLVDAGYQLSPGLREIHPLKADWPDECSWLFRNSFATMVHGFSHYIPDYMRWLLAKNMDEDYEYYRHQLLLILAQRPGQQLVLKDPCHLWHLQNLVKVFPDVTIIQIHRDPQQWVASFFSLCRALQQGNSQLRPLPEVGAYCMEMLLAGMERMLVARQQLPRNTFIDIEYNRLLHQPIATMEMLYNLLQLDFHKTTRQAMECWLNIGKQHSGKHRYALEEKEITVFEINQHTQVTDNTQPQKTKPYSVAA